MCIQNCSRSIFDCINNQYKIIAILVSDLIVCIFHLDDKIVLQQSIIFQPLRHVHDSFKETHDNIDLFEYFLKETKKYKLVVKQTLPNLPILIKLSFSDYLNMTAPAQRIIEKMIRQRSLYTTFNSCLSGNNLIVFAVSCIQSFVQMRLYLECFDIMKVFSKLLFISNNHELIINKTAAFDFCMFAILHPNNPFKDHPREELKQLL